MDKFWGMVEGIKKSIVSNIIRKTTLNEGMSKAEAEAFTKEQLDVMMSNPMLQICKSDPTLEFWAYRIEHWYKNIKVIHDNPILNEKTEIKLEKMLELLSDLDVNKRLGEFGVEPVRAEKCILYREYVGVDDKGKDKKYREEFIIEAEFNKDRLKSK